MFTYFGSKWKIAHLYPDPEYPLIIEPFAGSAGYSRHHSDHDVWLNDLNPSVYRIWTYLQQAPRRDIEGLPELKRGQDLRQIKGLSEVERDLLGLSVGRAQPVPRNVVTGWAADDNDYKRIKLRILERLEDSRDWKVTNLDYFDLPNVEATWFVDPPYQHTRMEYPENEIDYGELAAWCRSRKGQVIVCEELGADWLPFKALAKVRTSTRTMTEAIWVQG